MGKFCRFTFSLSLVKSTQILTFPLAFGTTTIPEHQSVGVSTREIIPCDSMRSSSCFTLGNNGIATLRGTDKANEDIFSLSAILYSPANEPISLNKPGCACLTASCVKTSSYELSLTKSNLTIAGLPKRQRCKPRTTKISSETDLLPLVKVSVNFPNMHSSFSPGP